MLSGRRLPRSGKRTWQIPPLEDALCDLLAVWHPFLGYLTLYALYTVYMGSLKSRSTLGPLNNWLWGPVVNQPNCAEIGAAIGTYIPSFVCELIDN